MSMHIHIISYSYRFVVCALDSNEWSIMFFGIDKLLQAERLGIKPN